MDLTQPLKDLVAGVSGAVGAVLIDNEGEAVTYFSVNNESERIRLIGAYHRIWLNDCLALTKQLQLGRLDHLIRCYEFGIVSVKALKDDYALVIIGTIEMYPGQCLVQLDKIGKIITEDL